MEVGPAVTAFRAWAPGRVCLFGEHQDYLGWPVVAGAIDLACQIHFRPSPSPLLHLALPDIARTASWPDPPTGRPFDYLTAAWTVQPVTGWTAEVRSTLPRQAGASSSTALVTAWVAGLHHAAGRTLTAADLASAAHHAEVIAQGEPGGQMDHLAIAHGGLHAFHFDGTPPEPLPLPDVACLLIDTQEPKQTLAVLARSKAARVRLVADPASASSTAERALLDATYASRDVSAEGTEALRRGDLPAVGAALNAHHAFLRDHLEVSTLRLEAVLAAALAHGAYGGKLNGSGGGGTAVVLAPPSRVPAISEAVRAAGGVPHLVQLGAPGAHILPA